jgi:2,4-dienoyl-CoA reductase (NADPH2)
LKRLFQSIKIGNLKLKNRIVMLSMQLGYAEGGFAVDRLVRFYEERAKGGAGLIIVGGAHIHPHGTGGVNFMAIDHDQYIPDLTRLAEAIRKGGSKSCVQLLHSGRYAFSILTGAQPVSASEVQSPLSGDVPRALRVDEIKEIVTLFTDGARRAREAGFDSVEVCGSTGYLISQFLSPFTNRRTDAYGGSPENRLRFAKEIVRSIKEELGEDYPLVFRLSFDDYVEGGTGLSETRIIAKALEEAGVDILDMQVGWHEAKVPTSAMLVPRAAFAYLAREIRKEVSIPVIVTNRINDPLLAEELLQDGVADLIGMARALIADPELPNKAMANKRGEIVPCIACNQGCMDSIFGGGPVACLVNPRAGRELDFTVEAAEQPRKVMVVGAGPGGMEAARMSAVRGHDVTLVEKEKTLGGQLNLCGVAEDRREFKAFANYLKHEVDRLHVRVLTGLEATEDTVLERDPDVVILATGAKQELPDIPGIEKPHVYTAETVLKREADLWGSVLVIGGGHIGCEVALYVAQGGAMSTDVARFLVSHGALSQEEALKYAGQTRTVTVVEARKKIAAYYGRTSRFALMQGLRTRGVTLMTGARCVEIGDGVVDVEREGKRERLDADTVVITSGYVEENSLYRALKGKVSELHVIGDARKLKSCQQAVWEAAELARRI